MKRLLAILSAVIALSTLAACGTLAGTAIGGGIGSTQGKTGEPLVPLPVIYGRGENMLGLRDRGADIEAVSPSGQTATLELAALHQFDRVYAMLERGASPTHPDYAGLTVATFAAEPLMKDSPQEPWRKRVAQRIGLEVADEEAP